MSLIGNYSLMKIIFNLRRSYCNNLSSSAKSNFGNKTSLERRRSNISKYLHRIGIKQIWINNHLILLWDK